MDALPCESNLLLEENDQLPAQNFNGPYTPKGLSDYVCYLFYPGENIQGVETIQYHTLIAAAEEIKQQAGNDAFTEVSKLAGAAIQSTAAYKFEFMDNYFQKGDTHLTQRNIFHPGRTIALAAYMSELIYYDYQIHLQLLDFYSDLPDSPEKKQIIKDLMISRSTPYAFSCEEEIYTDNTTRFQLGLPMVQINWERTAKFLSTTTDSGRIITSDRWRKMPLYEHWNYYDSLREIYPEVNIEVVLKAMPNLKTNSPYVTI